MIASVIMSCDLLEWKTTQNSGVVDAHLVSVLGASGLRLRGSSALGLGLGLLGRHGDGVDVDRLKRWAEVCENAVLTLESVVEWDIGVGLKSDGEKPGTEGVGGQSRSGVCPGVYMGKRGGSLTRE